MTTKAHENNGTTQAATFADLFDEVDRLGKAAIRERERSIEEMKRVQRETLEKLDELDEEAAKLMRDFHTELARRNARLVQTAKAESLALSVEIDAALHARQKPQPREEERSSLAPAPNSVERTRIGSHPSANGSNGTVKAAVEVAEQVEKDGEVLLGVPAANGMTPAISREGEQSQRPHAAASGATKTTASTAIEPPKPTRRRR